MTYSTPSLPLLTPAELQAEVGGKMIVDVESYSNYFLVGFLSLQSDKYLAFESTDTQPLSIEWVQWVMDNFTTIGFNSIPFDIPVIKTALLGITPKGIKAFVDQIILNNERIKVAYKWDHIDIKEVAPLSASLKTYAGRLHAHRMQELPFEPERVLTADEMRQVREYCLGADLQNTALLYNFMRERNELRVAMSAEYQIDLRSKSDAQIAEAVLVSEIGKINGRRIQRPVVPPGTEFFYKAPEYIRFSSPQLSIVLDSIQKVPFVVSEGGKFAFPDSLEGTIKIKGKDGSVKHLVEIGDKSYAIGVGGLHSQEKTVGYRSSETHILIDRDVKSYYPAIILTRELYPQHLGRSFLKVYSGIVDRRLAAKKAKQTTIDKSLKILINGSFGKLNDKYSKLYSPDLMIAVTITGQLALLLLIEMLVSKGFSVVSANTDGIVIYAERSRLEEMNHTIRLWEVNTGFETEEARYVSLWAKDVNNYLAVKEGGGVKKKGEYSEIGSASGTQLDCNPTTLICSDAVAALLESDVPTEDTIRSCQDISRFVAIRKVNGGAMWKGSYVGKTVRWYYAKGEWDSLTYKANGNKVPKTEGAKPCMELGEGIPDDINYDWYLAECNSMLKDIGYIRTAKATTLF